jgi:hypothetical protein
MAGNTAKKLTSKFVRLSHDEGDQVRLQTISVD